MADIRWDWVADLEEMRRDMERYMTYFSGSKPPSAHFMPCAFTPSVDIYDTADAVVVVAEMAGVKEEDMEISIDRDTLTLKGERKPMGAGTPRTYHLMEICIGSFERSITLPMPVRAEQAIASMGEGFLTITLPKVRVGTTSQIPVKIRAT